MFVYFCLSKRDTENQEPIVTGPEDQSVQTPKPLFDVSKSVTHTSKPACESVTLIVLLCLCTVLMPTNQGFTSPKEVIVVEKSTTLIT